MRRSTLTRAFKHEPTFTGMEQLTHFYRTLSRPLPPYSLSLSLSLSYTGMEQLTHSSRTLSHPLLPYSLSLSLSYTGMAQPWLTPFLIVLSVTVALILMLGASYIFYANELREGSSAGY